MTMKHSTEREKSLRELDPEQEKKWNLAVYLNNY